MKKILIILLAVLCFSFAYAGDMRLDKEVYKPQEKIAVSFSGFPGNNQDWITIVPEGTAFNKYGQWFYTKGIADGIIYFHGLPEGNYEVRSYYNWPDGGYNVQDRLSFIVGESQKGYESYYTIKFEKTEYRANEPIKIYYANLPGNKQDWITLAPSGYPDNQYGEWFYTNGQPSGEHTFKGLSGGEYEVRVFHNWPSGGYNVKYRAKIIVN